MLYTMKMEPVNLKWCRQTNDKNSNKRNRTERCVSYHYIPTEAKSHFKIHSSLVHSNKSSIDIVVKKRYVHFSSKSEFHRRETPRLLFNCWPIANNLFTSTFVFSHDSRIGTLNWIYKCVYQANIIIPTSKVLCQLAITAINGLSTRNVVNIIFVGILL